MAQTRFNGAVLAPWWKRAFSYQVDYFLFWILYGALWTAILVVGIFFLGIGAASDGAGQDLLNVITGGLGLLILLLGLLGMFVFSIWNYIYLRGTTGRTLGSRVWYLRVVSEYDGLPIGPGATFLRALCHIVDGLTLGIGYLLPLVTRKKQTIADMIMHTIVVVDERPVPRHITSFRRPRPPQDLPQRPAPRPQGYAQQPQQRPPQRPLPIQSDDPLSRYGDF